MKELLIILSICLNVINANSQNTCQTAFHDQGLLYTPLPPLGTTAQQGPDYGCVSLLSRPVWGYITSCDTSVYQLFFDLENFGFSDTVYKSLVIWGPFQNKTGICNNLTASNIFYCEDSIPYVGSFPVNFNIVFNTNPQEYYFYMLATEDTFSVNGYNTMHSATQSGGMGGFMCYECNDEVSQLHGTKICLLSFDSASQKTKIIWEKVANSGIAGYVIHRGVQTSGFMDSIAYVDATLPGEYVDLDSYPFQYGEYYRIQSIDSCGNTLGIPSSLENSCFLQTNPVGNNTVNLSWNNFGVWFTSTYEPVQYIYRGSTLQTMQIIDTIPFGIINYTDITAPPGQQYYSIERRKLFPCDPLRLSQNNIYMSAFSNPSAVIVTGLQMHSDQDYLSINPNPATDYINISINNSLLGSKLSLIDALGKTHISKFISLSVERLNLSHLTSGTYWIVVTGKSRMVKKIIIKN